MNETTFFRLRLLSDKTFSHILTICGIALLTSEAYKQLFLYFVINRQSYDWWFFPFQMCSLPMYLCLILPFIRNDSAKTILLTFMQDFGLLGGIAALLVPDGFRNIHWSLTIHGYVWHLILIFISIFIWLTGRSDLSRKGFFKILPFFVLCCAVAEAINILAPGHGQADMFYISPYHPSTQPVFHDLALSLGINITNLLYLLTVCLGGFLVHIMLAACRPAILRRITI